MSEHKESKTILEIIDLCKSFEAVRAIEHRSLSVQPGEIVGILGQRGIIYEEEHNKTPSETSAWSLRPSRR